MSKSVELATFAALADRDPASYDDLFRISLIRTFPGFADIQNLKFRVLSRDDERVLVEIGEFNDREDVMDGTEGASDETALQAFKDCFCVCGISGQIRRACTQTITIDMKTCEYEVSMPSPKENTQGLESMMSMVASQSPLQNTMRELIAQIRACPFGPGCTRDAVDWSHPVLESPAF